MKCDVTSPVTYAHHGGAMNVNLTFCLLKFKIMRYTCTHTFFLLHTKLFTEAFDILTKRKLHRLPSHGKISRPNLPKTTTIFVTNRGL